MRRGCNLDSATCRAQAPKDCEFGHWRLVGTWGSMPCHTKCAIYSRSQYIPHPQGRFGLLIAMFAHHNCFTLFTDVHGHALGQFVVAVFSRLRWRSAKSNLASKHGAAHDGNVQLHGFWCTNFVVRKPGCFRPYLLLIEVPAKDTARSRQRSACMSMPSAWPRDATCLKMHSASSPCSHRFIQRIWANLATRRLYKRSLVTG